MATIPPSQPSRPELSVSSGPVKPFWPAAPLTKDGCKTRSRRSTCTLARPPPQIDDPRMLEQSPKSTYDGTQSEYERSRTSTSSSNDDESNDDTDSSMTSHAPMVYQIFRAKALARGINLPSGPAPLPRPPPSECLFKDGSELKKYRDVIYFLWPFLLPHEIKLLLEEEFGLYVWESDFVTVLTNWYDKSKLPLRDDMPPPRWKFLQRRRKAEAEAAIRRRQANPVHRVEHYDDTITRKRKHISTSAGPS